MGSIVTLGLGRLEIDWGKNSNFSNHSALFLPSDLGPVVYHYVDSDSGEPIEEIKLGYSRSLESIRRRLELLGFGLKAARSEFEEAISLAPAFYDDPGITFEAFARALATVNVNSVGLDRDAREHDLGEFARRLLQDPEFTKTLGARDILNWFDGIFFENLHPYTILRLLAENPANLPLNVEWRFQDIVEGGYVEEDEIYLGVGNAARYLIVTEGSSDGSVFRKAFQLLRPDIADFFDFVDMSENYPFTGAGNLFRFCQGLARIKIQNKVVIVFDNDAAGREAEGKVRSLALPATMSIFTLPDLPECMAFPTIGPSGPTTEDINGRAVSIELFLDLAGTKKPHVRWTSYNPSTDCYQGELVAKESYTKRFLRARPGGRYDYAKLELLLDRLVEHLVKT